MEAVQQEAPVDAGPREMTTDEQTLALIRNISAAVIVTNQQIANRDPHSMAAALIHIKAQFLAATPYRVRKHMIKQMAALEKRTMAKMCSEAGEH